MVHYRGGRAAIDETVYPDLDAFWADLTAAYAEEVRAWASRAARYLQFDDTSLAYLNDPAQREHVREIGGDAEHQHEAYIRHINEALAGRPEGMAVTTHMCRGNFRSSWVAEGGYDFVAEALFGELEVDGFFMEWDDARSGGFEPLRFVPPGKVVVLGLVTTKRGELEDADMLKRRIEEAARYVDVDQLCLSPQCGFSSTVEGNALSVEQQAAKLRRVVEVAEDVGLRRDGEVVSADRAVAEVRRGHTVMVGGFGLVGAPLTLIEALVRSGDARDLTLISNNLGEPGKGLGTLLLAGGVRRAIGSYFTSNPDVVAAHGARASSRSSCCPQGTLVEAIRAGGAGLGGFYTPTGVGTQLAEGGRSARSTARATCSSARSAPTSR